MQHVDELQREKERAALSLALRSQGLIEDWWDGIDLTDKLNDPLMEDAVIEATIEFLDTESQQEWIDFVRGDKSNHRRVQLAEKCVARALKSRESLKSK